MNPLKYGQIIRICNDGLIVAKGFTDPNVYYMKQDNQLNNYRDTLFQILPRGTFEIHDEFLKHGFTAGLEQRKKTEQEQYDLIIQSRMNEDIIFGAEVIFRHLDSGYWLQGSYQCSEFAIDAFKLMIVDQLNTQILFRLMPHQTYQKEGQQIFLQEPLLIVHEKTKCKIDYVESIIFLDKQFKNVEQLDMLRPIIKKVNNQRNEAVISLNSNRQWFIQIHDDQGIIKPYDLCYFQYTANKQYLCLDNQNIVLKQYKDHDITPLDAIWEIQPYNGQYILRHSITGLILNSKSQVSEFDQNDINNYLIDMVPAKFGVQEISYTSYVQLLKDSKELQITKYQQQYSFIRQDSQFSELYFKQLNNEDLDYILFTASFVKDKSQHGFRIKRLNVQDKRDMLFVISSHEILQQFCEAIRLPIKQLEQVLNENILQQVLNVIVLLINYLSDKDGKPKKNIQKYYKDMMIIEIVMQIIFFISMKNDISTIFQRRKLEKEKLRLIYINTYLLIEKMIKQNQYVKLYISQWLELFLHQAMSFDHSQVQNTLNELLDDNYQAINKFIIPQTLQRLIKLICQKPPHQKCLRIFSNIVVCNNKAIISNQINILNMFYLNQEVDEKFKYKFKYDNQTYILCIVKNCGYKWRTLQQFYDDSDNYDGLQTWNYFLSYISLLSDICLNRNKFGRKYVQDNFTLQILCSLLEQEGEQQESILKLLHTSYIDCQEFTPIRRIARVREWHTIEQKNDILRTHATIKPEDCDLKRVMTFIENYLKQFTEDTIEESQLNQVLLTVLQVYQTTVRLGFYKSIEQLKILITNLLIISKCSKEKESDCYNPMLLSTVSSKSVKQQVKVDQNDIITMKCKALACEIIDIIIDMETNVRVSKSTQILKLQVNNHEQTLYNDSFWIDIFKNMIHDRNLFKDQDYILKVLFSELTMFDNPNLLKYSLQLLNRIYSQRRELIYNFDKILIVFKGYTFTLSVASRITRKKLLSLNDQNILKATLENQKEFNIFIWRESKQAEESGVIQDLQWLVECLKQQQNEIIKENIVIEYDQLYNNGLRKIYTERDINHKLHQSLIKCQDLHENIIYFIENAVNLQELGMKLLNSCYDFLTMLIWNHPENKQDFNIIEIAIKHLKFNVGCAEFLRELFSNNKVALFSEHYIGLVTEQSIKIADSLTFDEYYKAQLLDLLRILCHFNNKTIKANQLQIMANLQNRKYNNILLYQNTILNEIDQLIEYYQFKYFQSMQDQVNIDISPKLTYLFNYFQLLSILCEDQNEINLGKCKQMHSYEELIDIYGKSGQCWPLKRHLRGLINRVYYAQKEQANISQLLFEQDLENIIQDLRDILDFQQYDTQNIKIQNPTRYTFLSTYVYLTLEEILISLHILFNKQAFLEDLEDTLVWNFKAQKYKVHLELLEIGKLLVAVQNQWSNSQFIQQFCYFLILVCKTIYKTFSLNILILRDTLMNSIAFKSVIKQTTIQHTKYRYRILKQDVTTVYESEVDPFTYIEMNKNDDPKDKLIDQLLDGLIDIKSQGTILHKNQILYSDQLQDVDINVELNQNHKRLMQTLEQSDVFKIFLEEEFFQVCRKCQQQFRGDTLKDFIKNIIFLDLNQPQILDENLKIFFLKLLSRIIIEKNEITTQEIDFWTPEEWAPYKDSIEKAQNFLESCGAAELICSLLKKPKLEQRTQMTSELLKFGIAFLLGGNTKCQNSILSKLKTDQQNTILQNYNQLLKKISRVVYNNFKIRQEKEYQIRFKVHLLDNLEYYDKHTQTMQRINNWDIEDQEEKKQEFKQLLSRGFRYLQLLCENNNIEMKGFIRQQIDVDNTIKINTINFIEIATSQLRVFFKIINNNLLDTLTFILDFIIEIIQVPCLENQLTLCKTTFFEDSCYLLQHLSSYKNLKQRLLDERKDELQNIYDKILMVIMSVLEGNDEKIYEDLQNKLEPKFLQEIIMQNLDAMNIKTQQDLIQLLKTQKKTYSQDIQKILNVIIISEKIKSRKMNSKWQLGLKLSKKEPQAIIELLKKSILKIEIIYQGKRQTVLFPNHPLFNQLSVQTKDKIMYAIKRDTQREKIRGLLSSKTTIFNELEYNLLLSEKDITNENLNKISKLAAMFSILVNTYMIISYNLDIQKRKSYLVAEYYEEYIITVFEFCQLITTIIYYVLYLISRVPLCLKSWKDNNIQQEQNQLQWVYNKFIRFIRIIQFLTINEDDFFRLTLYLFFSLMGTFWKSYYFSLHLLDLISREDLLKNVFQAISQNAKQLMFVSLLGVAFIFVFSFTTFDSYVDDIYTEDDPKEHCETLISCMITLVTSGVIGNSMQQWDLIKFIYDTLYFVFFALLFTNIVSGIMIDTFAELRDERQKIEDDKKNMCFICGLDRATLEKNGETFEVHIHMDNLHYLWNYIFYIYCLQNKDSTEYSGLEYAISDMIEKDDTSWYFIILLLIYLFNQGFPQIKKNRTYKIEFKVQKKIYYKNYEFITIIISLIFQIKNQPLTLELANQLIETAKEIEQSLTQQKQKYTDYSKDQCVQKRLKSRNNTIVEIRKPIPQLKEVFSRDCLNECIFPLLTLQDLLAFRAVNSHIKINTENYLKTRILQEEKMIAKKTFQSDNLKEFKQYLYEQLPYIEWMMFDQLEIKQILKQNIRDVEKLRKLRTIPQQYDVAFKPYLTLQNIQPKSNYFDNFKKQTNKMQLQEKSVLLAVKEINNLNLQQIKKFSTECYNMITWCQASISLYLLENIFKVRLPKRQIQFDQLANAYYKQQKIINQAMRIIKAESKFVIFFDFKPQIKVKETKKQKIGYEEMLAYIMQYLDNFGLLRLRLVNQYSNKAVKEILRSNLVISIQNFEVYKLNNQHQYPQQLLELGFFSPLLDISYTFLLDRQREFIHHNNYDILKIDNLTSQKIQLAFESIYQNKLKSLIVQTSLNKFISKSCNPFNKDPIGIEFCLSSLQQMKEYCKLNPKSQYNFQSVYPLYLHLYLFILINHSIDPCFTIDDEELQQLFNQCKQLLNILYIMGNLKPLDLRDILNESLELLDIDLKQQLASNLNQQFFSIYQIFNQDIDNRDLLYQMATEIVQIYDSYIECEQNFKLNLHMYQELFTNHVMFYLSYQDLAVFAQVNQKAKQLQILHLRIRTQVESIQIRDFETVNKKTIQEQLQKQFKKDKAFHLIAELQNSDIAELRTIIHPTQIYDHYAQYFILLFDLQGLGNNWNIFLRFLQNPQAYQMFQQFAPETQSSKKMQTIFSILEENLDQIYKANKSLFKLVRWLQGIIQLHCYLRKYSLASNEITLFKFLDQKQLLIYKAIRYLNNFK